MKKGKGELTTNQIFMIIVFLICVVVFVLMVLWFKGYGTDVIGSIRGFIPGAIMFLGGRRSKRKGLSVNMTALWLIMAALFIIILIQVMKALQMI